MLKQGMTRPTGRTSFKVIKKNTNPSFWELLNLANPFAETSKGIRSWKVKNFHNIIKPLAKIGVAKLFRMPTFYGALYLVKTTAKGETTDYGLASLRVVTTVGVGYIVDAFQNNVELETMKYHGLGTGSTSEAVGDTALGTELTSEYTGNVRATGTTAEGATANIYSTVATNTLDGTPGAALREHGIFSASSSGDALQSTYQLTFTAGS
jgi:hypothetical protein